MNPVANTSLTPEALLFTMAFVFVAMGISLWRGLGLERELLVGTVRGGLQLLVAGYVLLWVFDLQTWYAVAAMLVVMVGVAAVNAARRGGDLPGVLPRALAAITLAQVLTIGLMLSLGIIPAKAQFIVPISGMVTGNAMVVAGLLLNRMKAEVEARRDEIQVWLSLGATPRQAADTVMKAAVRAGMIPSIDALKTVGLVQLPGMMTGQILAGASPIEAVKYQILVMYSFATAAAVCAITLGMLSLGVFFDLGAVRLRRDGRFRPDAGRFRS